MLPSYFKLERSVPANSNEIIKPILDENFGRPEDFAAYIAGSPHVEFKIEDGDILVQSIDNHNRAMNSPIMFPNRKDLLEIDLKSTGLRANTSYNEVTGKYERQLYEIYKVNNDDEVMGTLDYKWAVHDHNTQKKFKDLGIRTHESMGVIPLTEIYMGGVKYKIQRMGDVRFVELNDGNIFEFPKGYVPAQQIRAWGTAHRIQDIEGASVYKSVGQESNKDLLIQVINIVRQELITKGELGAEDKFGPNEYFTWFTVTLAKNIAKMHKAGYTHRYLHNGNITLDCRLTDFDSVVTLKERKKQLEKYLSTYIGRRRTKMGVEKSLAVDMLADLDGSEFGLPPDWEEVGRSSKTGFSAVAALFKSLQSNFMYTDDRSMPEFETNGYSLGVAQNLFLSVYSRELGGIFDFSEKDTKYNRLPKINLSKLLKLQDGWA